MKKLGLLFCIILFSVQAVYADNKEKIQAAIDDYLANRFFNAAFRFEDSNGDELAVGAKGIYDSEGKQLAPEQMMPIASGTKPMTAVIIMKLHERKSLNVRDKLVKYLGDSSGIWKDNKAPKWAHEVTLHHLLTHSSGIAEYVMAMQISADKEHADINKDILEFAASKALDFKPGAQYKYSNTNYVILGMIIEKLTGKKLAEVFDEEIFKPLGMHHTRMLSLEEALQIQNAPETMPLPRRYFVIPTGSTPKFVPAKVNFVFVPYADGGVISNASDLIKFHRALNTGKLVSPKMYQLMTKKYYPVPDKNGDKSYIGYGLFITELARNKQVVIHHAGSAAAIRSESGYMPAAKGMYFAILSNVMLYVPEEMKGKVDMTLPVNQLDILYFRDAVLGGL